MIISNPNIKLPYPKFLETNDIEIYIKNKLKWSGKCFFIKKSKFSIERDGFFTEARASASISSDIGFLNIKNDFKDIEFKIDKTFYNIGSIRKILNPDNSFNHYKLEFIGPLEEGIEYEI